MLGFHPLWGDRIVGMDLTCATSTPFLAVLLPSGSHLWIKSPQTQTDKQNYITGGPAKPCQMGLTAGN